MLVWTVVIEVIAAGVKFGRISLDVSSGGRCIGKAKLEAVGGGGGNGLA